jgi:membrane-bound metal-dependent hydrolase YbcI (DUF457 family)
MRIAGIDLRSSIVVTFIAAALSWIPDLDMQLGLKHRGITHTIPLGIAIAFIISLFFSYSILDAFFAFLSVLIAFSVHIFGDMFNIVQMRIFYPFSMKKYGGWKWFKSANEKANEYALTIGFITYALVLAFFKV